MITYQNCPCCGSLVPVHCGDEGTHCFMPNERVNKTQIILTEIGKAFPQADGIEVSFNKDFVYPSATRYGIRLLQNGRWLCADFVDDRFDSSAVQIFIARLDNTIKALKERAQD